MPDVSPPLLQSPELARDGPVLRLVHAPREALGAADAVLEAVARLHAPEDLPTLRLVAVEAVERLLRGCAAALFATGREPAITTLCASGPGWRTAERDGPAWLAPLCGSLADLVRADTRMTGRLVRGCNDRGPDLALLPLGSGDDPRHALIVAWPAGAPAAPADLALLDRLAPHLAMALHRMVSLEAWRSTAMSLRAAQGELVTAHAEQAASSVAGGVAHDLNNLLSVLLGLSDCLLASDALDAQARRDVETIHDAALATARLAQRLAFVARAPREGEPGLVDLRLLARRAAERINGERENGPGDPTRGLDSPPRPACVRAQVADLTDVVTALLRLQAETSCGRPHLEVTDQDVSLVTEGPAVRGFDDEGGRASHYSRETRWRGPVLTACRRFARVHGWGFTVALAPAGRQRITLTLPLASASDESPRRPDVSQQGLRHAGR